MTITTSSTPGPSSTASATWTSVMRRVLVANQRWPGSQAASASDGGVFDAIAQRTRCPLLQPEPVEAVGTQRQEVRLLADGREARLAEQLQGHGAAVARQIQRGRLGALREIGNDQDRLVAVLPVEGQHGGIEGPEELDGAAAERRAITASGDEALHRVEERGRRLELGLHVDRLVAVHGIGDDGQVEAALLDGGEAGVAVP